MEQADVRALGAIQRRLSRLITEPSGIQAALAEAGDADAAQLARLVRGDRGLASVDRLAVYANAYFSRLHDCLREDFGSLARALGHAAFHDLVKTYLMMHPPKQPSLRHAGAHLAEHLATEPFAEIFSRRCPYAADLARLEWAMTEAFYAADASVLSRADLEAVAPDAWQQLQLALPPSLRLLACDWPVHDVRARFDRETAEVAWEEAPQLAADPTYLCVWRLAERVRYRSIIRLEFDALGAVRSGAPFGAVCDLIASAVGESDAPARAGGFVSSWLSEGLLALVVEHPICRQP